MRPLRITVENFLPFYDRVEIDLTGVSSAIISGPNGAGKSSFFIDAVLFALFGQARKRPEGLIHDLADKMKVELLFSHRDQRYKVLRSIERGKQQRLKIFSVEGKKEKELTERLLTNTQTKLDDILGISYGLLLSTSISQQEDVNRLFSIQPAQRQDVIMEMLSLDYWDRKKDKISEFIKDSRDLEDKIEKLETEIFVAEGRVSEIESEVSQHEASLGPLSLQRDGLVKEIESKQGQATQAKKRQELQTELSTALGRMAGMDESIAKIKQLPERQKVEEVMASLVEDVSETKNLCKEAEEKKKDLSAGYDDLEKKEKFVEALIARQSDVGILNKVPCKGTPYHDRCDLLAGAREAKKQAAKYLEGMHNRFGNLEDALSFLTSRKDEIYKKVQFLATSKTDLLVRQEELNHRIEEQKVLLKEIIEGRETRRSADSLKDVIEDLSRKIKKIPELDLGELVEQQHNLRKIESEIQELEKQIIAENKEIELTRGLMSEMKTNLDQHQKERARISGYQILHQAYGEIPAHLFGNTIPHIEAYANEILAKVDPQKRIQLRPFKDTKSGTQVKALDVVGWTGTGLRDFENLSGSEKFRQGLAVRVALARVNAQMYNTQIGFFIVDEGFGSLDEENLFSVKDILREVSKQFDLFLVITHIEQLKDTFDEEICVSPFKQGSRIDILKH